MATPEIPKRKKVTPREYVDSINDLLSRLEGIIDEKKRKAKPGVREYRSIKKDLVIIKKNFPKIRWVEHRRPGKTKSQSFSIPRIPSAKLRDFLKLGPDDKVSQLEVAAALGAYVYIKPDEKREQVLRWKHLNSTGRDLRKPDRVSEILPDEKLAKLLDYDSYVEKVKEGEVFSHRKDKETGRKHMVQITDSKLNRCVILKLIARHLKSASDPKL
jgi:hypothetical protein